MTTNFSRIAVLVVAMALLSSCGGNTAGSATSAGAGTQQAKIYRWKLITTWPKNLPGLGNSCYVEWPAGYQGVWRRRIGWRVRNL